MSAKYIQQHAPVLDWPLKKIRPASLEKYLKELHEAVTYPKYNQLLYHMASFRAMSLNCYVKQDIDYEAKRGEFLDKVKARVLKREIPSAIIELRSEADTLKTYNPNYA